MSKRALVVIDGSQGTGDDTTAAEPVRSYDDRDVLAGTPSYLVSGRSVFVVGHSGAVLASSIQALRWYDEGDDGASFRVDALTTHGAVQLYTGMSAATAMRMFQHALRTMARAMELQGVMDNCGSGGAANTTTTTTTTASAVAASRP